jgi:hypothetical protein
MEIFGLLDTLESLIVSGRKIWFTDKVIIDEVKVLTLIDKMRLVIQAGPDTARKAVDKAQFSKIKDESSSEVVYPRESIEDSELNASEVVNQAYQIADEVKLGADKYAEEVLTNLTVVVSRMLRTIENGRIRLQKSLRKEAQTSRIETAEAMNKAVDSVEHRP